MAVRRLMFGVGFILFSVATLYIAMNSGNGGGLVIWLIPAMLVAAIGGVLCAKASIPYLNSEQSLFYRIMSMVGGGIIGYLSPLSTFAVLTPVDLLPFIMSHSIAMIGVSVVFTIVLEARSIYASIRMQIGDKARS